MLQQAPSTTPSDVWCGRSWEGLGARRRDAFAHARALGRATSSDAPRKLGEFLLFFEATGIGLFRDEEEWIFDALRPAPPIVIEALEQHVRIGWLVKVLLHQAGSRNVDLGRVRQLGEVLGAHLLMEEEKVRPLTIHALRSPRR